MLVLEKNGNIVFHKKITSLRIWLYFQNKGAIIHLPLKKNANLDLEPIMIYSDDLTHIVSEVGIAYLHKCHNMEERMNAIRAVAGKTEVGKLEDPEITKKLRKEGIVTLPEDFGIDPSQATRELLAAKNMKDLVDWSGGLYNPPAKFRNW